MYYVLYKINMDLLLFIFRRQYTLIVVTRCVGTTNMLLLFSHTQLTSCLGTRNKLIVNVLLSKEQKIVHSRARCKTQQFISILFNLQINKYKLKYIYIFFIMAQAHSS
jgi:hypothetical protein